MNKLRLLIPVGLLLIAGAIPVAAQVLNEKQVDSLVEKTGYFGIKGKDRIAAYKAIVVANEAEDKQITDQIWADVAAEMKKNTQKVNLSNYEGSFTDPWVGEVRVENQGNKLFFQSVNSPKLGGEMAFYKGNTFVVKWTDRSMHADAFVIFALGRDGKAVGIKMEAVSPATDFSYDFHDLDFTRTVKK